MVQSTTVLVRLWGQHQRLHLRQEKVVVLLEDRRIRGDVNSTCHTVSVDPEACLRCRSQNSCHQRRQ